MTDLFNQNDQDHTLEFDPAKDYKSELVGDGKKFKDDNALAYSNLEKDRYIKFLERGRDQLREDYTRLHEEYKQGPKLQELIDQFKNTQNTTSSLNTPAADDVNKPVINPEDIDGLIQKRLTHYEMQKKQTENMRLVETKLREAYGNDFANVLLQKVNELGLSKEWANETAQNYPTVLFKTLGIDQQRSETFQAPPTSSQRSDNFSPASKVRDWDYYEHLRKTQPKIYWDTKTQVQLHKDMQDPRFKTQSWHSDY